MLKNDLLKLKRSLLMLVISACLVGGETKEEASEQTFQEYLEIEQEKERTLDKHCVIIAGDQKIIFRNCDLDYWVDYISTDDGKKILKVYRDDGFLFELEASNYLYYTVDSQLMIDYENLLVEEGAKVYQITK